jgi:AcrR family transcriptional regulator
MIVTAIGDRRNRRHEATRAEILDAAIDLARVQGLAALSMRDLAARVGMRQPSLYTYFASKNAIYDALFSRSWRDLEVRLRGAELPVAARDALSVGARLFVEFCLDEPARFQLMCQRPVPGFEPTEEAFAPARDAYEVMRLQFADRGITDPAAVDIWTALITGLVNQQLANDPGGDRWTRLIDAVVDMFLAYAGPRTKGTRT